MPVLRKILFKLSFSSNSLMSLHTLSVEFQPHLSAAAEPAPVGSTGPLSCQRAGPWPAAGSSGHAEHRVLPRGASRQGLSTNSWLCFGAVTELCRESCDGQDLVLVILVWAKLSFMLRVCGTQRREGPTHGTGLGVAHLLIPAALRVTLC